jgi:hypothetical protein
MEAARRFGIHEQAAGADAIAQRGLFRDVEPQCVEVDLKRIAVRRERAFGGPWIGLQLCRQVGRIDFLERTFFMLVRSINTLGQTNHCQN